MIAALRRHIKRHRELHALRAEIAALKRWRIHEGGLPAETVAAVQRAYLARYGRGGTQRPQPDYGLIAARHADLAGLDGAARAAALAAIEESLAACLNVAAGSHVARVLSAARDAGVCGAVRDERA
ncbi:hypothetical protein [Euryhalocaulis caribicus]|uniref:hypothetical protein n=1 Tax=Euryhalocaulis caribicus TaxID=1161401 RepID=UPI0003A74807|nr:hypothetical protein [Euryhalocaulis caribicus]